MICKVPVTPKLVSTVKVIRSPGLKTPKSAKKNKKGETPLHIAAIKVCLISTSGIAINRTIYFVLDV